MLKNVGSTLFSLGKHSCNVEQIKFFHVGSCMNNMWKDWDKEKCVKWKAYNEKVYPPQSPDEPRRPAFICHQKEHLKYPYKKMWFIACLVRGMSVDEALKQLSFLPRKGALMVRDTILEAQELAVKEHNVEFKSNLWISESFVGKSFFIKGIRRHAKKRVGEIRYGYIHYFVTLEEGTPPEHYYYHHRQRTGEEMLTWWLDKMRKRKIPGSL